MLQCSKKKKSIVAIKKLKKDWIYKSHFIKNPIFPGSLQIEAMLQASVLLIYILEKNSKNPILITKTLSNFYGKISGTGKLTIKSKIVQNKKGMIAVKASIFFLNKKKISDGSFTFINPNKSFLLK